MTGHVEAKALLEATILPIWRDAVKININNSTYTWPTGEQLRLGFFGDMCDYQTWIGQSWPWIGWEELTQFPDDKFYKQMLARTAATILTCRSWCDDHEPRRSRS